MQENALDTLIREIIPLAFVLTPNIPEAETITGMKTTCIEEMREAALVIHKMGAKNVLIKGGYPV